MSIYAARERGRCSVMRRAVRNNGFNMLKFGLHRLPPSENRRVRQGFRDVSCRLLKESADYSPQTSADFEFVVRNLRLSSGIYRRTYPGRFADLDVAVNATFVEVFGNSPIEVHDWAASDCSVSAEWAASLWHLFPAARFVASDILFHLIEVSKNEGQEAYILEPDGAAIQYIRPPFVLSLQEQIPWYYPVNSWLASKAKHRLDEIRKILNRCQWPGDENAVLHFPPWTLQQVSLIHPRARFMRASDSRFEIRQHSVFAPLPAPSNAIRTMNIFNRGYFNESKLLQGIHAVFDSLSDGGIWIVGRTTEETRPSKNRASIFQKRGPSFFLRSRLNGGAEIEDLILSNLGSASRMVPDYE